MNGTMVQDKSGLKRAAPLRVLGQAAWSGPARALLMMLAVQGINVMGDAIRDILTPYVESRTRR
ncbi:MAG: hypothetical protein ACREQV_24035, partial [Candidatus Binatia bacterium]